MGIVIGPIDASPEKRLEEWFTMRETLADIHFYQRQGDVKFKPALEMQLAIYKDSVRDYSQGIIPK